MGVGSKLKVPGNFSCGPSWFSINPAAKFIKEQLIIQQREHDTRQRFH